MQWPLKKNMMVYPGLFGLLVLVLALGITFAVQAEDEEDSYIQQLEKLTNEQPFFTRAFSERRAFPYLEKAFRLNDLGQSRKALAELDKYLVVNEQSYVVRWHYVNILAKISQSDELVKALDKFLQYLPDYGPALMMRARALQKLEQDEKAVADYYAALIDDRVHLQDKISINKALYHLSYNAKDYESAQIFLNRMLGYGGETLEVLQQQVELYEKQGNWEGVNKGWQAIAERSKDKQLSSRAGLARSIALEKQGNLQASVHMMIKTKKSQEPVAWYTRMAVLNAKLDNKQLALDYYRKALSMGRDNSIQMKAAELAWQMKKYNTVVKLLEPLTLEKNPSRSHKTLHRRLCDSYTLLKQYELGFKCITELLQFKSTDKELLRQATWVAEQLGPKSLNAMVSLFESFGTAELALKIALTLEQSEKAHQTESQPDNAVNWYKKAFEITPDYDNGMLLVNYLSKNEIPNEQLQVLHKLEGISDLDTEQRYQLYKSMAVAYESLEEYSSAIVALKQADKLAPDVSIKFQISHLYGVLGRHDEQLSMLEEIEGLAGLNAEQKYQIYKSKAVFYGRSKQFALAIEALTLANEITPSKSLELQIAHIYGVQGQLDAQIKILRSISVEKLPEKDQIHWYQTVGDYYHKTEAYSEAVAVRRQLCDIAPTAFHWAQLAQSLSSRGELEQAEQALLKAVQLDENVNADTNNFVQLAYINVQQNNDESAVQYFEKAVNADSRNPDVMENYSYLLARQYQNQNASHYFKQTIDELQIGLAAKDTAIGGSSARIDRIQAYNRILTRKFQLQFHNSIGINDAAFTLGTFRQGIGELAISYQPTSYGFRNGRTLQYYIRSFWANETRSLAIEKPTFQPAVGLRIKPFEQLNAQFSVERMFTGGDNTSENVMLRAAWSHTIGSQWAVDKNVSGVYLMLYADAAKLLQQDKNTLFFSELRVGQTRLQKFSWLNSLFGYLRGSLNIAAEKHKLLDAGLGMLVRGRALYSSYEGHKLNYELSLRAGYEILSKDEEKNVVLNVGLGITY